MPIDLSHLCDISMDLNICPFCLSFHSSGTTVKWSQFCHLNFAWTEHWKMFDFNPLEIYYDFMAADDRWKFDCHCGLFSFIRIATEILLLFGLLAEAKDFVIMTRWMIRSMDVAARQPVHWGRNILCTHSERILCTWMGPLGIQIIMIESLQKP